MISIRLFFRFLDGPRAHGDALELSLPTIKVGSNPTCPRLEEGTEAGDCHALIHELKGHVLRVKP